MYYAESIVIKFKLICYRISHAFNNYRKSHFIRRSFHIAQLYKLIKEIIHYIFFAFKRQQEIINITQQQSLQANKKQGLKKKIVYALSLTKKTLCTNIAKHFFIDTYKISVIFVNKKRNLKLRNGVEYETLQIDIISLCSLLIIIREFLV